jgi:hypothetical protein
LADDFKGKPPHWLLEVKCTNFPDELRSSQANINTLKKEWGKFSSETFQGVNTHKKKKILTNNNLGLPSPWLPGAFLGFTKKKSKVVSGFFNFGNEFLAVGVMLEGDSADICAGKFPLTSMWG